MAAARQPAHAPIMGTAMKDRDLISRKEAKALGLNRYFTGKPCKRGHIADRIFGGGCTKCMLEADRRWRERNPEVARLRYENNREKRSEQTLRWQAQNPERKRATTLRWARKNPEKIKINDHRRRARKINAGGSFTAEDVEEIRKLQRNRCARCGKSLNGKEAHIDHIIPLARGGSNDRRNLQFLDALCNLSKHARDPIDDMRRLGRLL